MVLEQMDLLLSTITQDHGIFTAQVNSDSASSPLVSGIYNLLGFVGFFRRWSPFVSAFLEKNEKTSSADRALL